MKPIKTAYNYISDYLIEVRSKGRFTITLAELQGEFDVSEKALLQNIYRLKVNNQIAQIRKEFYVIIPPQYLNRGMLPPPLFIDDMMRFLDKDYYVGLYSAAALHGAGHTKQIRVTLAKEPKFRFRLLISYFSYQLGQV